VPAGVGLAHGAGRTPPSGDREGPPSRCRKAPPHEIGRLSEELHAGLRGRAEATGLSVNEEILQVLEEGLSELRLPLSPADEICSQARRLGLLAPTVAPAPGPRRRLGLIGRTGGAGRAAHRALDVDRGARGTSTWWTPASWSRPTSPTRSAVRRHATWSSGAPGGAGTAGAGRRLLPSGAHGRLDSPPAATLRAQMTDDCGGPGPVFVPRSHLTQLVHRARELVAAHLADPGRPPPRLRGPGRAAGRGRRRPGVRHRQCRPAHDGPRHRPSNRPTGPPRAAPMESVGPGLGPGADIWRPPPRGGRGRGPPRRTDWARPLR